MTPLLAPLPAPEPTAPRTADTPPRTSDGDTTFSTLLSASDEDGAADLPTEIEEETPTIDLAKGADERTLTEETTEVAAIEPPGRGRRLDRGDVQPDGNSDVLLRPSPQDGQVSPARIADAEGRVPPNPSPSNDESSRSDLQPDASKAERTAPNPELLLTAKPASDAKVTLLGADSAQSRVGQGETPITQPALSKVAAGASTPPSQNVSKTAASPTPSTATQGNAVIDAKDQTVTRQTAAGSLVAEDVVAKDNQTKSARATEGQGPRIATADAPLPPPTTAPKANETSTLQAGAISSAPESIKKNVVAAHPKAGAVAGAFGGAKTATDQPTIGSNKSSSSQQGTVQATVVSTTAAQVAKAITPQTVTSSGEPLAEAVVQKLIASTGPERARSSIASTSQYGAVATRAVQATTPPAQLPAKTVAAEVTAMPDKSESPLRFEAPTPLGDRPATTQPTMTAPTMPADQARYVAQQMATAMPTTLPGTTEITLRPEELGRVRMTLTVQDGAMTLVIQADRPETTDLMRRHIDQLMQTYRQMGFESLNFSFAGSAQRETTEQTTPDQFTEETENTAPDASTHSHPASLQMADGRLDLRI